MWRQYDDTPDEERYLLVDQNGKVLATRLDYYGGFSLFGGYSVDGPGSVSYGNIGNFNLEEFPGAEDWELSPHAIEIGEQVNHFVIGGNEYVYNSNDMTLSPMPGYYENP